ncbi:MAG TPA: tetratricopeptide repeat protein [Terriglobia bacterium]|nr:tetratricopeptide repeat protein [Terriglobia bacterium]
MLVASFALLGVLFAFTGFVTQRYHATQRALAQRWYIRGEADLQSGQPEKAIEDLETALVYVPGNNVYRLRLAEALEAAQRLDEAQAYLLSLWSDEPSNGEVNLDLGRLAARAGSIPEALRYYHNAIYGIWSDNPEQASRNARLELCQALFARKDTRDAEAELIALAGDLPEDADLHVRVGNMFLAASDFDRALRQFQRALALSPRLEAALFGAGQACFELARYEAARPYLERALRWNRGNTQAARLLETTSLILEIDPFSGRLSAEERSSRVVRAYEQAMDRLESCAQSRGDQLETTSPQTPLEKAYAQALELRPKMRESILRRDPDLTTAALDAVVEAEKVSAVACGAPTGLDHAILLAAQRHGGGEPD